MNKPIATVFLSIVVILLGCTDSRNPSNVIHLPDNCDFPDTLCIQRYVRIDSFHSGVILEAFSPYSVPNRFQLLCNNQSAILAPMNLKALPFKKEETAFQHYERHVESFYATLEAFVNAIPGNYRSRKNKMLKLLSVYPVEFISLIDTGKVKERITYVKSFTDNGYGKGLLHYENGIIKPSFGYPASPSIVDTIKKIASTYGEEAMFYDYNHSVFVKICPQGEKIKLLLWCGYKDINVLPLMG